MNTRIATLRIDPVYVRAIQTQARTGWLIALAILFQVMRYIFDDEYFMYFTVFAAIAFVLNTLAGWALIESSKAKQITDLERRGLRDIQHMGQRIFVARHNDQKVWVYLVQEGQTQMGVWIKPFLT